MILKDTQVMQLSRGLWLDNCSCQLPFIHLPYVRRLVSTGLLMLQVYRRLVPLSALLGMLAHWFQG